MVMVAPEQAVRMVVVVVVVVVIMRMIVAMILFGADAGVMRAPMIIMVMPVGAMVMVVRRLRVMDVIMSPIVMMIVVVMGAGLLCHVAYVSPHGRRINVAL
jgi:hypothetical protein